MSEDQVQPPKENNQTSDNAQKADAQAPIASMDGTQKNAKEDPRTPDTTNKKRKRKPLTCFEIWTIILASLGILVAGGTGLAVYWQAKIGSQTLCEIQRQYPELKKSADAADNAAKAALKQLEITSAATLQYGWGFEREPSSRVSIEFTNIGQSTASKIHPTFTVSVKAIPSQKLIGQEQRCDDFIPNIPAAQKPGTSINTGQYDCKFTVSPEDSELLENGKAFIAADFTVTYENGFEPVEDRDCQISIGFKAVSWKTANGTSSGGGYRNSPCGEISAAIQENDRRMKDTYREMNKYKQKPN